MSTTDPEPTRDCDRDVAVVGGGPAGCSAAVFCAREGLDTVVFDRGRSSLKRCAHLENYLGFPAGIDVETLYGLIHAHAETAGAAIVPDLVESVDRADDGEGFVVTPQEGDHVSARRVIAATRYDGSYLRGLGDDAAMFDTYEHDGEEHDWFDREYAAHDGTTPVDGLYVASPSDEADTQAIMAAGRGARVAHRVIADARIDAGWWEAVADGTDWVRREAELDAEWSDRDRWTEWFDDHYGEDAPVDTDSERYRRVRAAAIDDSLSSYVEPDEIEERATAGQVALASHLDADRVAEAADAEALVDGLDAEALLDALDDETLLDAVDDDSVRDRAAELGPTQGGS
ncbi:MULTISPECIES: NAD(P)/FAD-dependent oxidoreductase [Halorubrum]|uniref:Thioredoxin reductase n=1 Tax=Halorubrum tropicale TaxID=1765655 RepID=A0A0M9AQ41_9EURY|nr:MULTISPECIES: NAD(P)/FAD-dependent oxidoreductase [Halorubrum]KOX96579.1 thioredoxin reductase [Halorubrum tropicale]TKX44171.1 NAD(P)/FAD-dependent oxidoreductase [Halorubrum sp. ARQ200]TKX50921.1 NAD(P)/FAD-dependent oxidoreductase [Halorubrum sp. ASP121]TKX63504.1 NAD(P)/FAD-dependent oxidoreductase [Halorubrum sp. ASP1]